MGSLWEESNYWIVGALGILGTIGYYEMYNITLTYFVVTLALGSRPKQGFARLRAKREAREWKKVWGNEPSHSQKSFHFGSWSPGGLPNVQRAISRVKNQWLKEFFYTIRNLLKLRCLKWARMTHLNIWNTSYGQKKGRDTTRKVWCSSVGYFTV